MWVRIPSPVQKNLMTSEKKKLKERVGNNESLCKDTALEILYSLSHYGLLKEPYNAWINGFDVVESDESKKYNLAIEDLGVTLLMFKDENTKV